MQWAENPIYPGLGFCLVRTQSKSGTRKWKLTMEFKLDKKSKDFKGMRDCAEEV